MPTPRTFSWCFYVFLLLFARIGAADWSESFHVDATLNDVYFPDPQTGWCVGDRGTIYHTRDAGATWERQVSPADCSLESVHFLDVRNGWAVGGRPIPYTTQSESIVLATVNGGETWTRLHSELLPWLKQVRFFDRNNGIACGLASNMYPSGIVTTKDGGLTWTGIQGRVSGACQQFDVGPNRVGFGVTSNGQVLSLAHGSTRFVPIPSSAQPFSQPFVPDCVAVTDSRRVILGGGHGTLRTSRDNGESWETSTHSAGPIGLRTITSVQDHIWAGGAPGNAILRSTDGGNTWRSFQIDNALPLNAMYFTDVNRGWAVGGMGTVMQTLNGGQTWQRQSLSGHTPVPHHAAFMVVTNDLE
ncbi:WD40/YVTN/BNR-like repeat-containing protein, partial [Planctomycetota bacterium]